MSAREKAIAILDKLFCSQDNKREMIAELMDNIIAAAKEEIIPKDQTYQEFFGLKKPEPQLIQGYTAEQWQEIIDGGYLCEFNDSGEFKGDWTAPLTRIVESGEYFYRQEIRYTNCRPAQIKGAMRPIFVEPVDRKAGYVFFDRRGSYLGTSNFFTGATWNETIGCCMSSDCTPTKYIEL